MSFKIKKSTTYATTIIILIVAALAYKHFYTEEPEKSPLTGAAIVCNSPYIRFEDSCCLDKDSNRICDNDETVTENPEPAQEPTHDFTPIQVTSVKIEGNDVKLREVNGVAANQGEKIKVEIIFIAEETDSNVEAKIHLSGVEEDSVVITESKMFPKIEKGTSYTITFYPVLPTDVRDDNFKMDMTISSLAPGKVMQTYRLNRNEPEPIILFHEFWIDPENAKGGENVSVMVDFENRGQMEKFIKISVSVPQLNAGAFTTVENMEKWDKRIQRIVLPIPQEYTGTVYNCVGDFKDTCYFDATVKIWFDYDENNLKYGDSVWRNGPLEVTFDSN